MQEAVRLWAEQYRERGQGNPLLSSSRPLSFPEAGFCSDICRCDLAAAWFVSWAAGLTGSETELPFAVCDG